ncbi:MAG TPA: aldolase/citrate lyase family protein, partial [Acetobacteraceae bacterium]|nr:aldolase/citrate lyase family protein [Acetobacteraceae bacterium]
VRCCKDALYEGTRCLDNGAMGVVVPHVDTAEEAKTVARAFRYPPVGERSWGGPPAQFAFTVSDIAAAQAELNREIFVCVMIETPQAVANADAIAAVAGVDSLMIGTSDLTASMGIPGQIGHADVRAAYEKVAAACKKHGKVMGMGGVYDEKVAPEYIKLGARFLLSGSDHAFLMAGGGARARFLRGLLG